jgi:hypothetical protein
MVLPTVFADGLQGNANDFANAPGLRTGAISGQIAVATLVDDTAQNTIVGLVPFNAGAVFHYGSAVSTTDVTAGSTTTLDVGVAYADTVEGADALDLFVDGSTVPQTGGVASFNDLDGMSYVTTGKGYLVGVITAAATDIAGTMKANVLVSYNGE